MTDETPGISPAPIRIESITCRSFRGLDEATLVLHPRLTVLVGRNNAGKSRLLRAIAIAVGAVPPDKDDLTVGGPPTAEIDIVVAPSEVVGNVDDGFDGRLGATLVAPARQTISESPLRERVSWRTTIQTSAEGFSARATRRVRQWDATAGTWADPQGEVSGAVVALIRAHLIETGRDLAAELRRRGTAANRLINDLEIEPAQSAALQKQLDDLSGAVVAGSQTLQDVKQALSDLASRVDSIGQPNVRPVPGRIDDLSTVASIELAGGDGSTLPLHLHGTGARSMTSLRLQGLLYERRLGADGGDLWPHAVTLVEEPEAHLHPQAQFDLPALFEEVSGQVIVSTHSTHLVGEVEPEHLRIIGPGATGTSIVTLEPIDSPDGETPRQLRPQLYRDEMEKLRRTVERPFGELLFSTAVVIGDGATERALLPVVLRHGLGVAAHGLCVIDPGSMNSPSTVAVVKAALLLSVPWFIFADDDEPGQAAVAAVLNQVANPEDHAAIESAHIVRIAEMATEQMFAEFDLEVCRDALAHTRPGDTFGSETEVIKALKKSKGSTGRFLGQALIARYPDVGDWPQPLKNLVEAVGAQYGETVDEQTEETGGSGED